MPTPLAFRREEERRGLCDESTACVPERGGAEGAVWFMRLRDESALMGVVGCPRLLMRRGLCDEGVLSTV
jgi:hypothetical protein